MTKENWKKWKTKHRGNIKAFAFRDHFKKNKNEENSKSHNNHEIQTEEYMNQTFTPGGSSSQ